MADPRKTRKWNEVVRPAAYRRDSQAIVTLPDGRTEVGARCWICGERIDYSAPFGSAWAWEPDHYVSVNERPDLAYDLANLRPSHSRCNRQRHDGKSAKRPRANDLGAPSRAW